MQHLQKLLEQRKATNTFRSLPQHQLPFDFCSNDYLGLAANSTLQSEIEATYAALTDKRKLGATGSRLISGNFDYYQQLEPFLAQFFKGPAALVFASGYSANMGVLSAIPQKGDTVLYDELSHACIKDGIRLSFANRFPFRHNDLTDLEQKLKKSSGHVYVVVESIYSMDGDAAPLNALATLCKAYGAYMIVDEAHGTGVFGPHGEGLCVETNIHEQVAIRIHTFGKAVGAHGAVVIASADVISYLVNFSRPFIYATGLPLHSLVTIHKAIEYMGKHPELRQQLNNVIDAFKNALTDSPLIPSNSAIQAYMMGSVTDCKRLAQVCNDAGFWLKAIVSPTVKKGTERIRICLHAHNTVDEIHALAKVLTKT